MYEINIIHNLDGLIELRKEWNQLVNLSNVDVFSTWEWIYSWWNVFGKDNILNILTIKKNDELIGIAPIMKTEYKLYYQNIKKIEFIGVPDSDFNNFIIIKDHEIVIKKIIENILSNLDYHFIIFKDVPDKSIISTTLLKDNDYKINIRYTTKCPYLELPNNIEIFNKNIKRKLKKNINYRINKLSKLGKLEYINHQDNNSIDESMNTLYKLHNDRYKDKNSSGYFFDKRKREFHSLIAKYFYEKGWLNLGFLVLDGTPIASEYSYNFKNITYAYQSGFNPEYNKFGIGRICEYYHIKKSIENNIKYYSWTRGFESYISDWTNDYNYNIEYRIYGDKIFSKFFKYINQNRKFANLIIEKIPFISKEKFRYI